MKRDLVINIVGGTVATIVGGIVMWMLEPRFKSEPESRNVPLVAAASAMAFSKSASRLSPEEPVPETALKPVKYPPPTIGTRYVNANALSGRGPITPVATNGSADASRAVLDVLAVPLKQGVFTRAFFGEGIFERALNGEGSEIVQLKLPKEVHKIVLLQVGESTRTLISETPGAIRIKRRVAITVMNAQSGTVIKSEKFSAEGVGFDEEFVERSLQEDLAARLEPVRRAL